MIEQPWGDERLKMNSNFIGCVKKQNADEIMALQKDAARYRWLRERLMAADFDWQDSGECALVFAWPKDCSVSGNCDATIDAAMLKTPNME